MNTKALERTVRAHIRKLGTLEGRKVCADLLAEFVAEEKQMDRVIDPTTLVPWFVETIGHRVDEQFAVVFIGHATKILGRAVYPHGSRSKTILYPRQLFFDAFKCGATNMVLAHNHPGGCPTPSYADRELTRRLAQLGDQMEVHLVAHYVVVSDGSFLKVGE